MFWIFHTEEEHTENHIIAITETPNCATSHALDDQRLLQYHAERVKIFHSSKI